MPNHKELEGCEIVVPLEKTFYGATHFFIREPGGHVIGFSQKRLAALSKKILKRSGGISLRVPSWLIWAPAL